MLGKTLIDKDEIDFQPDDFPTLIIGGKMMLHWPKFEPKPVQRIGFRYAKRMIHCIAGEHIIRQSHVPTG